MSYLKKCILKSLSIVVVFSFFLTNANIGLLPQSIWANEAGKLSDNTPKPFNLETFSLPENLGSVKDSWQSKDSDTTVIHLQDAHCVYPAQKKNADIIQYLNAEYGISTINLEGGKGEYDLSMFTGIDNNITREKVVDYFVKQGLVSGTEYLASINPEKIDLWGIEDTSLYVENLNVYRNYLSYKDSAKAHLKKIRHMLNNLKTHIYSNELKTLDEKYTLYKKDKIEFREYLGFMYNKCEQNSIDTGRFKDINLIYKALDLEHTVDFKQANAEREELLDRLEKILSDQEFKKLAAKAVEFRKGLMSQKEFYAYLMKKAKLMSLNGDTFENLKKYFKYVSVYDSADKIKAMAEINTLEQELMNGVCQNQDQKDLITLSKNLILLENLFDVKLTPEDYGYYKENKQAFDIGNYSAFINKHAPLYKIAVDLDESIHDIDVNARAISKFYECSLKRDQTFLKNLKFSRNTPRTTPHASRVTILVTGGFHTQNLSGLFKQNNISYISIIPNFDMPEGYESPYFRVLSGEMPEFIKPIELMAYSLAVASPLTELGITVKNSKYKECMRMAAAAIESLYGTEPGSVHCFELQDGTGNKVGDVVFELGNDSMPACRIVLAGDGESIGESKTVINHDNTPIIKGDVDSVLRALSSLDRSTGEDETPVSPGLKDTESPGQEVGGDTGSIKPFRFQPKIWAEIKKNLESNSSILDRIKEHGFAWTDSDRTIHFIDDEDILTSEEAQIAFNAAKDAINTVRGKEKPEIRDIATVKAVMMYHETAHALLQEGDNQGLVAALEAEFKRHRQEASLVVKFKGRYGSPHGNPDMTETLNWVVEELLVLAVQERELFGSFDAVADELRARRMSEDLLAVSTETLQRTTGGGRVAAFDAAMDLLERHDLPARIKTALQKVLESEQGKAFVNKLNATAMYDSAKNIAENIAEIMHKVPTYAIEPAASLETQSAVMDFLKQTEKQADRKGHHLHARAYLADGNWDRAAKGEISKVLPEFYSDLNRFEEGVSVEDSRVRMIVRLISEDGEYPQTQRDDIVKHIKEELISLMGDRTDLDENGKGRLADTIIEKKIHFVAAGIQTPDNVNTVIDLLADVTMVECDRYGKSDGYVDQEPPVSLQEKCLYLLRLSMTNYDDLMNAVQSGGKGLNIANILSVIFTTHVMRTRPIDWSTHDEMRRASEAVIQSV